MVGPQEGGEFFDGLLADFFRERTHADAGEISLSGDTLHHGGVGCDDQIVLVHTPVVVALALEHTDHSERNVLEANGAADGILSAGKEFVGHRLADDTDFGVLTDVFIRETVAFLHGPELDGHILGRFAVDGGCRIVVAVDHLSGLSHFGRDMLHVFQAGEHTLIVRHLERLHRAGILPHAASHVGSGAHGDDVGAHLGDFLADALLRPLTDGHHDDDGSHTDDDAERREQRSALVAQNGPDGNAYQIGKAHSLFPFSVFSHPEAWVMRPMPLPHSGCCCSRRLHVFCRRAT